MVLLTCLLIILVGLSPAIAGWWLIYRNGDRLPRLVTRYAPPTHRGRAILNHPTDPERRHIRGVGYIIGDLSCRFNARSAHLRCAVNPMGPCQGCTRYDPVEIQPLESPSDR